MNKILLSIVALLFTAVVYVISSRSAATNAVAATVDSALIAKEEKAAREAEMAFAKRHNFASELKTFATENRYATDVAFLVDMSLPSGKKRFFVYDLQADSLITSGLVAHGSCNERFLKEGRFANVVNSGCTSIGIYKVGYSYNGNFGKAYKLFGLDSTNNKAFERYVVLHGYTCVPDEETAPQPICNSLGCPMVSYAFLEKLEAIIDNSRRPILLWIYE
ncbi:MAG: murein L,D-transpeptidase catalytic domain-containing protein [Chitinophagaceae bacterium]